MGWLCSCKRWSVLSFSTCPSNVKIPQAKQCSTELIGEVITAFISGKRDKIPGFNHSGSRWRLKARDEVMSILGVSRLTAAWNPQPAFTPELPNISLILWNYTSYSCWVFWHFCFRNNNAFLGGAGSSRWNNNRKYQKVLYSSVTLTLLKSKQKLLESLKSAYFVKSLRWVSPHSCC